MLIYRRSHCLPGISSLVREITVFREQQQGNERGKKKKISRLQHTHTHSTAKNRRRRTSSGSQLSGHIAPFFLLFSPLEYYPVCVTLRPTLQNSIESGIEAGVAVARGATRHFVFCFYDWRCVTRVAAMTGEKRHKKRSWRLFFFFSCCFL